MALLGMKEFTGTAALRTSPPRHPTSASRSSSTYVAPPAKSKLLAMLDAQMNSLSLDDSPPPRPAKRIKTTPATADSNLLAPSTGTFEDVFNSSLNVRPYFTDNYTFGESWPLRTLFDTPSPTVAQDNTLKPVASKNKTIRARKPAAPADAGQSGTTIVAQAPSVKATLYTFRDYSPSPVLVYTRHEEEADDLVQSLKGPLGFDLEWRVLFRKGMPMVERRTAVVQLSDEKMILVIQISAMQKFPQKVKEVIESSSTPKIGANIANDGRKLFNDFGILPQNLVELGGLAREADPQFPFTRSIVALATMVERYTSKTLDKGKVRSSNWEDIPLNPEQLEYAANDAHCALMVYNRLFELAAASGQPQRNTRFITNLRKDYESGKLKLRPAPPPLSRESTTSSTSTQSSGTSQYSASRGRDLPIKLGDQPRPQHMRAYNMWHNRNMSMDQIRAALRSKENPLAISTVISYVVWALQADASLPFSMSRLKEFVQLEAGSWRRHRDWIASCDAQQKSETV